MFEMGTDNCTEPVNSGQKECRSDRAASKYLLPEVWPVAPSSIMSWQSSWDIEFNDNLASERSFSNVATTVGDENANRSPIHEQACGGIVAALRPKVRMSDDYVARTANAANSTTFDNQPTKNIDGMSLKDMLAGGISQQPSNSNSLPFRIQDRVLRLEFELGKIGSHFEDAHVSARGSGPRGKEKAQTPSQRRRNRSVGTSNKAGNSSKRQKTEPSGDDIGDGEEADERREPNDTTAKDNEEKIRLVCPFAKHDPTHCDEQCFEPIDSASHLR